MTTSTNASASAAPSSNRPARGQTKSLILQTALRIASRNGIEGLTIGELAKAVGMSKSGLFAHFQGKDNLQLSVLQLATERFVDAVMKPAFAAPRGEPRLKALFKNWLSYMNDENSLPGGSILISASTELDDRPGALRDFVQKAQKDLIRNIEKAARIAMEEGHFRKDLDVEQFAWSLYSFVLGYHHFKRMLEDPKAELHVKRSFKGLLQVARA
jgi:AcrR family transcriptional regulator